MHVPGSVRVGAAWLLAVPFLVLARPTPGLLLLGGGLAVLGLVVRGWAAGTIEKGRDLAISGPYAHTRNPMYVGSFVIGLGLSVAGGHWVWPMVFTVFFVAVYLPTMSRERAELAQRFGARFLTYAAEVPSFVPRLSPYRDPGGTADHFVWSRYLRYREWEALLGVAAVMTVLALKLRTTA